MTRKLLTCALAACTLVAVASANAEGPHDKAIEARQAMFKILGFSTGMLGDMAKGDIDYNAELAAEAAKNLDAAANLGHGSFWPEGSDNANSENVKNRALPEIWEMFSDFGDKLQNLKDASKVLASEAGNGKDALQSSIGNVGKSCKGCHDEYRGKR